MKRVSSLLLAVAALLAACGTERPTQPADVDPLFEISDATHAGGTSGFYWLPPMVSPPTTTGTFIGSLSPTVEICQWLEEGCIGDVWTFTMTSGPGSETVGVDVHGQHYHLNWRTGDFLPDPPDTEAIYRITVLLGDVPLGWADVQFFANGGGARNLKNEEVIPLADGRTLPIKFRIEAGVLEMFDFDLVYHSTRQADTDECMYNVDVYLMDREKGVHVNLTNSPKTMDGTPSWSPDGTKIAFASDRAVPGACGPPDLYIMNADGTDVQLLTANGWKPAWSPDGTKIAFQRGWPPEDPVEGPEGPGGRNHNIWVIDLGSRQELQLTDQGTDPTLDPYEDLEPTWHPNGKWVTFARKRNEHIIGDCPYPLPDPLPYCSFDIVSVDVNTSEWVRHTYNTEADHISPRWSPDGEYLVYQFGASGGNLWALYPAPTNPSEWRTSTRIPLAINNQGDDQNPSWSPSGEVVFTSFRNGGWGIYYVDDWNAWKNAGPGYLQTPLIGGPGEVHAWAQFRPY